jgi:hypothetical protein
MQSFLLRNSVYLFRERERINAMDHFEQRQRVPDFVFLEMPHEMPPQIRRQVRNFGSCFLDAAFTEQSLPSLNRLAHFLGWMSFRDRDKLDRFGGAPSFRCRLRDLLANALEVLGN